MGSIEGRYLYERKKCPGCGAVFTPRSCVQIYCHKACGHKFRVHNDRRKYYSNISKTPENFIRNLMYCRKRYKKISSEYVISIYRSQNGLCALSGEKMTHIRGHGHLDTNISIDRIDSSKDYVEGNIQLVCTAVNLMKSRLSQEDFIRICTEIAERHGRNGL